MKILITSATKFEIETFANFLKIDFTENEMFYTTDFLGNQISILITGVGMFQTIYSLTKHLNTYKYDFAINLGICGAYSDEIPLGEVVNIVEEQFGDFGFDNNGIFNNFFDSDLINKNHFPFTDGKLLNSSIEKVCQNHEIKEVSSITVNTVNGEKNKIETVKKMFDADVENMEGAGFFYVCLMEKIPFMEIRAVSNLVEARNKENWKIQNAISKLTDRMKLILLELIKK